MILPILLPSQLGATQSNRSEKIALRANKNPSSTYADEGLRLDYQTKELNLDENALTGLFSVPIF